MRQSGKFEQWPVHLMLLNNRYFSRVGGFVMFKDSPYTLDILIYQNIY